ncbi:MAG: hypothetical protein WEC59_04150, partial [Salibacteraceae bacterium]
MKRIYEAFVRVWHCTPQGSRSRLLWFVVLLWVSGLFELVGLGMLIPFMNSLLQTADDSKLADFFTDYGVSNYNMVRVFLGGSVVLFFIVKNLFFRSVIKKIARFAFGLYAKTSKEMFEVYLNKPISNIKNANTNYIIRDIDTVPKLFAQQIIFPSLNLISELTVLVTITIALLIYDFRVILSIVLIVIPPFAFYYSRVKDRVDFLSKRRHDYTGKLRRNLQEMLFGISEVRVYQKSEFFKSSFERKVDELKSIQAQFHYYSAVPPKIIETAIVIGIVFLFGIVVYLYVSMDQIALTLSIYGLAA